MGIIQENRVNAPKPKVQDTDYGAQYVTAGTETPVQAEPVSKDDAPEAVKPEQAPAEVKESADEQPKKAVRKGKKSGK